MGLQKHGFGELGKKLLINLRIADHFHILCSGRNVLIIDLAIPLPDDPVEHNADLLTGRFAVERTGHEGRGDLLMQIYRLHDLP